MPTHQHKAKTPHRRRTAPKLPTSEPPPTRHELLEEEEGEEERCRQLRRRGRRGSRRHGREAEMRQPLGACGSRSSPAAAFFLAAAAICAQFATGLADDPSKDGNKDESKGHTGQTVLFVLLGIGGAGLLSFFLFKYWQKKKREEQHARLLKLFEEDDDIEVELGLRD